VTVAPYNRRGQRNGEAMKGTYAGRVRHPFMKSRMAKPFPPLHKRRDWATAPHYRDY